jgi:hypothetical protein
LTGEGYSYVRQVKIDYLQRWSRPRAGRSAGPRNSRTPFSPFDATVIMPRQPTAAIVPETMALLSVLYRPNLDGCIKSVLGVSGAPYTVP